VAPEVLIGADNAHTCWRLTVSRNDGSSRFRPVPSPSQRPTVSTETVGLDWNMYFTRNQRD
jgi:hypothetical protein